MLKTTAYDQDNACIIGHYHDAKGNRTRVEYIGSALECECYINGVRQANEGSNEVHSHVTLWCNVPIQSNPLMTCWNTPV